MKWTRSIVAVVTLVPAASRAAAQQLLAAPPAAHYHYKFELAPFVGYRLGGSLKNSLTQATYGINESVSYGGVLEVALSGGNRLWLLYSRQESEIDTSATGSLPVTLQYIQAGGVRDMTSKGAARPFVAGALGLGLASGSGAGSNSVTKFGLSASLGLKTPSASRLVVRAEARGFLTFVGDQDAVGTCGGAGCSIAFSTGTLFQGELALGLGLRF